MKFNTSIKNNKIILHLYEEINLYTVAKLKAELENIINNNISSLVVNMANVTYIDSSGIGALIGAYKKITAKNGKLYLCELPEQVFKVFKLTSLHKIFPIYNKMEDIP